MNQELYQILNAMGAAAAAVDAEQITWCSTNAERLGLCPGMRLQTLLPQEFDVKELAYLRQLNLPKLGARIYAQVYPLTQGVLLVLQEDEPVLDVACLAQTSRMLRTPLNEILATSRRLFEQLEELEDPRIQKQTAKLTHSFYQIFRTASALSDLQSDSADSAFFPKRTELCAWLAGIMAPASSAIAIAKRTLQMEYPSSCLYAEIDSSALEQALWCLLSNAVRYSPEGSTITLRLQAVNGQCLFSLHNQIAQSIPLAALTGSFPRPLSVDDTSHGLGLGILRAQRIVRQHEGVLLLECTPKGEFVARLRLPGQLAPERLRAVMPADTTGGYNRMLVELSDVLPDEVYDSRNF